MYLKVFLSVTMRQDVSPITFKPFCPNKVILIIYGANNFIPTLSLDFVC